MAVFQVMSSARARTSSRSTSGWKRMPPLYGPARAVVLDAVAGEDVDLAVAEAHRHLDLHLAVRRAQHRRDVVRQLEPLGRQLEPVLDDLVVRDLGSAGRGLLLGLLGGLVRLAVPGAGMPPGLALLRNGRTVGGLVLRPPPPAPPWPRRSSAPRYAHIQNRQPPKPAHPPTISEPRGHSSVGRAFGLHPKGRRFESGWLHTPPATSARRPRPAASARAWTGRPSSAGPRPGGGRPGAPRRRSSGRRRPCSRS